MKLFEWEYRVTEVDQDDETVEIWLLSNCRTAAHAGMVSLAGRHPGRRYILLHRARIVDRRPL